jgi:eukaryotic-like serine/threonine-protein kinase
VSLPAPGLEGGVQRRVRLGRYDLIAQLGSGGMADVFLGVARKPGGFNKLVVLKVLRAQYAHDVEFSKMFFDEARLSARFNHPNVVQTFEVEEDQGRHFLVMEYLEGQPLAALENGGGPEMPLPAAVRVLCDVLSALHYAHELCDHDGQPIGIVHRDVSPQNVFVTYDGPAKLLDFGVAKARNALSQTQDGAIKGKVRYMAPEQVRGDPVDRRADVFAAGILLWRAATGKKLWDGYDQLTIMHRLDNREPVPAPHTVRPDVPKIVDELCSKALALDADDRFQSAAEFSTALEEYLHAAGALGSHRTVARFLESRFAAERAAFRAFVDERVRSFEGLPIDRVSSLGEGRRWVLPFVGEEEVSGNNTARGVVASSRPPSFGALSDFPDPISSVRPPAGMPRRPSASSLTRVPGLPRSQPWPLWFGAAGLVLGVLLLLAPGALRLIGRRGPAGPPVGSVAAAPSTRAPTASARANVAERASATRVPAEVVEPRAPGEPVATAGEHATGGHATGEGAKGRGEAKGPRKGPHPAATPTVTLDVIDEISPPPAKTEPTQSDPCASPYYVDERGVKKIKPECL